MAHPLMNNRPISMKQIFILGRYATYHSVRLVISRR